MSASIQQIRLRLDAILAYMQPHWEFVNCHMVNYLTDQHWQRFVPVALREELTSVAQTEQCIETIFWQSNRDAASAGSDFPNCAKFVEQSKALSLHNCKDVLTTVAELQHTLFKDLPDEDLTIKEFMSEKKQHEVEITAALVDHLITYQNQQMSGQELIIIDAGGGKGYLSSRLALQYRHKVIGVDANVTNTENALDRSKKLQRAWNGLTARADLQSQGIKPPRRGKKQTKQSDECIRKTAATLENYKTVAKFITTDLNLTEIANELFPMSKVNLCLTGLHTCGNLAATCLQVFHAQKDCKILCNIGCCYHLLKEHFSGQEFFGNKALMALEADAGFPLSQYLQQRKVSLGRNARMLAAQSIERTLSSKELPNISLYYRALLEVLICAHAPALKDAVQVGKIRRFDNFSDYVHLCAKKLDAWGLATVEVTQMRHIQTQYALDKHYLDLFYLLRMSFAPVLESLILLDRLLYLKELDYDKSYLIPLFDAVISPRHFAIVALKNQV